MIIRVDKCSSFGIKKRSSKSNLSCSLITNLYPVSNSENLSAILVVVSISTCPMKDTNPNCVICLMILYRKLINYLYTPETKFFYIVATYSQKSHGT
jgi:hypothetical protein